MKNIRSLVTLCLFVLLASVQTAVAQQNNPKFKKIKSLEGVEEYLYTPNGLKMLLVQDNAAPVVTVQMVYKVGSKNEVPGNTGSTHLLEHLMFKGTKKYNKKNGNSIDTQLTRVGAQMNATTWNDRTNYYETIPSDKLELALDIEADRMRNLLLLKKDKEAEMTVVRNEFERGENNPNSLLNKEIWATAYLAHPYHHSTIGWRSDIENMPIQVLRDFYDTYYWPNNAVLTVVGDFNKEELFPLVDKYFGKIPRSEHTIPVPYTEEPTQYGPRQITVKKPGETSVISVAYKIPGVMHEDIPALDVLAELLGSGTSSVLSKEFIDSGKAFYANASTSGFAENGLFTVSLGFDPSKDIETLNKQLLETVAKVKKEGVEQSDVDRIVSNLNAQTILSRDGSGSIAAQLTEYIAGGDWTNYINESKKLAKVTAADVHRVAKKYLVEDQSTTGHFIPKRSGSNADTETGESKLYSEVGGKQYYRNPEMSFEEFGFKASSKTNTLAVSEENTEKEKDFSRKTVSGIDVITKKTGAKGFVTVATSFPIGNYFNGSNNEMVPTLTTAMLSKGTTKNDKFQFSQKLERLGVNIYVSSDSNHVNISFKSLSKDVETVIGLLAEELRHPLFDEKEFELLKTQFIGNLQQGISNPGRQGSIALKQALYPKGHPNYALSIEESIEQIKNAKLQDLKNFHKRYFGPAGMHLVAVGDIDNKQLYSALEKNFKNWKGGIKRSEKNYDVKKGKGMTKVMTIPEKPSAELFIGQYTGLQRTDADFLPFHLGNYILGGGFSGRLMLTVRDEAGLTYGIYTRHAGHTYIGGYWYINASFNPSLFNKGKNAALEQVENWVKNGITETELKDNKSNIIGSFKIGLSTTSGMAANVLAVVERGEDPSYIYQYPKDLEAVTQQQINKVIKKYIDLDKLVIIGAGSLNEEGKPLEENTKE
ncbi:M16 family metallopeptidase [Marixanthomonas spongiae]|uniref:Insulinase family protein n=1 Tax=Marixanthomonas spongiae TaxID=2174845 RepID=A0A2U0HUR9_9FLAO|nr:pitrilysin family protein [Marixanthomonas spongiae]PVW12621.1 insulinase family protein [Marixanthomonas spongiae]